MSVKTKTSFLLALTTLLGLGLGGCRAAATESDCERCGVIEEISSRTVKGEGSPAAAIAGAVIGGVVGHQFGSGSGNDAATAAGAIGGAAAGNEIERRRNAHTVYDVIVDLDKGGIQKLELSSINGLAEGDRVQVIGNDLQPL